MIGEGHCGLRCVLLSAVKAGLSRAVRVGHAGLEKMLPGQHLTNITLITISITFCLMHLSMQ